MPAINVYTAKNNSPCFSPTQTFSLKTSGYYSFSILSMNARSVVNKLDVLDALLTSKDPDLTFIVETWLKPFYPDSFVVNSSHHSILRSDRLNERGGGAAVIFPNSLASKVSLIDFDKSLCKGFDLIAIDFFHTKSNYSRFVCVYLPPCNAKNVDSVQSLLRLLTHFHTHKSNLYVLGDFNFSNINWKNPHTHISTHSFSLFKTFLVAHNLKQLITFPTHDLGNTLDLFITSNPQTVTSVKSLEPLTSSCDHNMIEVNLNLHSRRTVSTSKKPNFYKGDYTSIISYLKNIDWDNFFCSNSEITNLDTTYSKFIDLLQDAIKKFIPVKNKNKRRRMPQKIKSLLRRKKSLYKLSKTNASYKKLYKEIDKQYRSAIKNHTNILEKKVMQCNNKKSFYGYINRKLHQKHILPPFVDSNAGFITESKDKANLLNQQFSSVFINDDGQKPPIFSQNFLGSITQMDDFHITPSDVSQALARLKNTVSQTPDSVPAFFLKKVASVLSRPLSRLFNTTLSIGKVPIIWKKAIVTPIFKKGLKSNPANYRPISLTSVICRILEIIIHAKISYHLLVNNALSRSQHGFLPMRSTQTQQLNLLNDLIKHYSKATNTHVVYLDFSKAFDSVSHHKLLYILKNFKISPKIIAWISDYLSKRSQQVIVDGLLSDSCSVTSGVPQGSVLGPLLFLLYIEDLLKALNTHNQVKTYAFADDLKLSSTSPYHLQMALHTVENWTSNWQLKIHPTKSEHITISPSPQATTAKFYISNEEIPHTSAVKDLGVHLCSNLKFSSHIETIYSKGINLVHITLRSFKTNNFKVYVNLYKTYIRPILEYNCTTWMPFLIGDVEKVESVQATFTRKLCKKLNIKYTSYYNRLEILGLETLELRRIKIDMIITYKIINNLIDLDSTNFFNTNFNLQNYNLRRNKFHLAKAPLSTSRYQVSSNFFSHRVINTWNKLSNDVVCSGSLQVFKSKLNKVDLSQCFESKLKL